MLQIVQHQKTGEILVEEMPFPNCPNEGILVKVHFSLISAGTEKASIDNAKGSLLQRARKQPDQVKLVLNTLKQHGLLSTISRVQNKLNSYKTLGYSAAGEVIESNCREFLVGDRVAIGGAGIANHSEICAVPKNLAIKLEEKVSYQEASFTTVGAIALQGIRQSNPSLGEYVVVIGLGLLGILTVQMLKANGCRVIGLDINESLFENAYKFGCDVCFKSDTSEIEKILNYTKGIGADSTIICASTSSDIPMQIAMNITRKKGNVVIVGAVGMNIRRQDWYTKEIDLKISCSYGPGRYDEFYENYGNDYPIAFVRWTENRNMQAFMELIADSKINVTNMISKIYKADDAKSAYDFINNERNFLGVLLEYDTSKNNQNKSIERKVNFKNIESLNIALVGAGQYAQNYLLPEIKKNDVNLYGLSTSTAHNAKTVAEVHNFKIFTTDSDDLISNKEVNAVFIASSHSSHSHYVIKSLERNLPVFVEKPLAINLDELDNIKKLIDEKNGRIMVGYNRRFSKPFIDIESFYKNINDSININYRINAGKIPKGHWVQQENEGGRIIGEVCHFVDACIFFTKSLPISVYAECFSGNDITAINQDNLSILLKFSNGSTATINYIANGAKSMPKEYIEILGGSRSAIMNNFESVTLFDTNTKEIKYNGKKGVDLEIAETIKSIKNGNEMPIKFSEIYTTSKVTFAILESLKTKTLIKLD